MIIKLQSSAFGLAKPKAEIIKKEATTITREQWITADRIVIATLFLVTIVAAILF